MFRLPTAIISFLLLFAASCSNKPADGVYKLELYAHGDVHGCFFDSLYTGEGVRESSLSKIYSYLEERRELSGKGNVIAIDLGDHIHGDNSTYYYNYVHKYSPDEKHLYSRIAGFMGYDAIVAGNHDIEPGREVHGKIKDEIDIPYLAANVVNADSGNPYFSQYTILERNGLRIAVIGLTTPEVKKWLGKEKIAGLDILPIRPAAESLVYEVKDKHSPHLIFLAVHAGCGDGTAEGLENPCRHIASTVLGIDGVLAAHDHIPFCGREWNGTDSVIVVNSGPYARKLSGISIGIEIKGGKVLKKKINAELIDMRDVPSSAAYSSAFHEDWENVREFSSEKLGFIDEPVDPKLIFDSPCLYSNLLHYVQLKETQAKVSFVSPTKYSGIIPAGEINYNDVLNLYPFENILYKVKMTGAQIRKYLELSYSNWKSRPVAYDCAGGLRYIVDMGRPLGSRVQILSFIDGTPFNENETYPVAMASYRANGGGDLLLESTGLDILQLEGIVIDKYRPVRNLIYDFFKDETKTAASLAAVSEWSIIR